MKVLITLQAAVYDILPESVGFDHTRTLLSGKFLRKNVVNQCLESGLGAAQGNVEEGEGGADRGGGRWGGGG